MPIRVLPPSRRAVLRWALLGGLVLTGSMGVTALLGAAGSRDAMAAGRGPSRVRLDYAAYNPVSLVLKERGLLEQALKKQNIQVEWVLSQGSNKALEYLAARRIDFGSTAGAAAFVGRANGAPIKAIYVYSKPEWTALVVRNGSKLRTVRDLKGRRVAANRGTDPYIFLLRTLDRNGLAPRDVTIVQLSHADGKAALERGSVDAWAGLDPLMAKAEVDGKASLLYRNPDFNTYGILNVREQFARENPATVLTVLRAYEQARLWALKNPQELRKVLIREAQLSDAVAARQLQRTDLRHSSIGAPEKASILAAGDVLRKSGVIPASTESKQVLKELIDTRYTTKISGGR